MIPTYPIFYTDAGRSQSKRPRQKNDCTVRALALVRDWSYDRAYEHLKAEGRRCGAKFQFTEWLNIQEWTYGRTFPAVKGQPRMNPVTFCKQFPTGTWIVKTAKHVFVVKDGTVLDEVAPADDRCIYRAWRIEPS